MTTPVEELKIRARLLRKGLGNADPHALSRALGVSKKQRWPVPQEWTLSLCLNIVSAEAGFDHWEHARRVLGGEARLGDDLGKLWYDRQCFGLTNQWFAGFGEASHAVLKTNRNCFLLPYARQFLVVEAAFIEALGLSPSAPAWAVIGHNLAEAYGMAEWQALALERLRRIRQQ